MRHVSLFSGIGGIDLAAEWAGFQTVLFCEQDKYCRQVLKKHWPGVPIIDDIREVSRESVNQPVTLISGGFPCQPFSVAGKRRGKEADRYLWPEMLRVIREIAPRWILAENVPGLLSVDGGMEIENMLTALEIAGYETLPLHYPAAGVGANHLRNRVFIVAHDGRQQRRREQISRPKCEILAEPETYGKQESLANSQKFHEGRLSERAAEEKSGLAISSQDVSDASGKRWGKRRDRNTCTGNSNRKSNRTENVSEPEKQRLQDGRQAGTSKGKGEKVRKLAFTGSERCSGSWWATEPDVGRVAHGIPHRVDRLKCLGNAVVPQQAYPILQAIAAIEGGSP